MLYYFHYLTQTCCDISQHLDIQFAWCISFHLFHSHYSPVHSDFWTCVNLLCVYNIAAVFIPSYTCLFGPFSSDTFCLTGSFTVTIYETGKENMEMMSHPVSAKPDNNLTIRCPHISHFNRLENPRWFKVCSLCRRAKAY